jgi:hypothetical protein
MIHLIGDKKLALRFRNNAVTSGERFLYFFLSVIFSLFFWFEIYSFAILFSPSDTWTSFMLIPHDSWDATGKWDIFVFLFCLAIAILGTDACYHSNRSGDNKEFIERYICIGFVTSIRLGLILIPLAFLAHGLVNALTEDGLPHETGLYDLIFYAPFLGYFYWRLNNLIKIAAH